MFRFELEIPLVSIRTELMYQHYEMQTKSYIAWQIYVWKWHWTLFWGKSKTEERNSPKGLWQKIKSFFTKRIFNMEG